MKQCSVATDHALLECRTALPRKDKLTRLHNTRCCLKRGKRNPTPADCCSARHLKWGTCEERHISILCNLWRRPPDTQGALMSDYTNGQLHNKKRELTFPILFVFLWVRFVCIFHSSFLLPAVSHPPREVASRGYKRDYFFAFQKSQFLFLSPNFLNELLACVKILFFTLFGFCITLALVLLAGTGGDSLVTEKSGP